MECKMIAAITWTQLELKGLLEDEESHVYYERAKRHLGLHPFHLTDLNAALREILTSTVNSYDAKLQGIILSYKNPKLLTNMGTVLYDTCYIHIDIDADFYIFRPNVGDTLKGIVNKKSQDHVGILVHKTFNATIPRPEEDENWPGHSIHIGQEVRFTVTCLDFKDRLPYIRGSMDEDDYLRGCKAFNESLVVPSITDVNPKKITFSYSEDGTLDTPNENHVTTADNGDYSVDDSGIEEKVSRKKSKKLKLENIDNGICVKTKKKQKVEAEFENGIREKTKKIQKVEAGIENGIRVKTKKKQKVEAEVPISEDEADLYGQNESLVRDDGNLVEEFLPGKLKLKRESIEDKIHTKKKKKKSKVKAEESMSESEYNAHEMSQRPIQEANVSDEYFAPRKSKKVKKEKNEEQIDSKNSKTKTKAEVEVEILDPGVDSDAYNRKMSYESGNERNRKKKPIIKTEVLSSETESDTGKLKQSKRMKVESGDQGSIKKYKIKSEVLSSEMEYSGNEANQSVESKHKSTEKKSKKKRKIKAEVLQPETYD